MGRPPRVCLEISTEAAISSHQFIRDLKTQLGPDTPNDAITFPSCVNMGAATAVTSDHAHPDLPVTCAPNRSECLSER